MPGDLAESQWRQIMELAHAAADLSAEERRKFVESSSSDPAVVSRVLELAEEFASLTDAPNFDIGSQVGRFTITGRIGRGGMGQVYSAKDSELHRTVALKVLLPGVDGTSSPSNLIREARTASALNHPNILTIHEVLKIGAAVAIVMEFVPGDSLRDWISAPHQLADSLALMSQIAGAIEVAHAAGIVHRDLKPENVIVRPDKRVKVLDFGLAKSLHLDDRSTGAASIARFAGTIRYMAPEQWSGAPANAASDIFSLGVIFYEMATGRHPFDAPSPVEVMRNVAEKNPPAPSTLNPAIPPALDDLISQMLARAPADRPSALQIVSSLTKIENSTAGRLLAAAPEPKPHRRAGWMIAALSALALASVGAWRFGALDALFNRSRFIDDSKIVLLPLANELGYYNSPTFSPDGRQIAYSWNGKKQDNFDIYVEVVGSHEERRLTTDPDTDYSPAWSPDGKTIAFCRGSDAGNAVWIMSALGGSERKVYDLHWRADYSNRHLSWSADSQRLAFPDRPSGDSQGNALIELDLGSGVSRQITFPSGPQIDIQPAYSPDGKSLAFIRDQGGGVNRLYILPLEHGAKPHPLDWQGFDRINVGRPVWTPDSRNLLTISSRSGDSRLWAGRAEPGATPHLLASLGTNIYDTTLSSMGKLAVVYQHYDSDIYKLDLGRLSQGMPVSSEPVMNSTRLELNPKVSPDGRKIAFESNRSGYQEIWTANTDGSDPIPLTDMQHPVTGSPSWSHDGRRILCDSRAGGPPRLYVMDAVLGRPQPLTTPDDNAVVPVWSVDDSSIYFSSDRGRSWEIWRVPRRGGNPEQITTNGGFAAALSPDGTLLYYAADRGRVTQLRALDLATRKETVIAPEVLRRNYVPTRDGVYYISGRTTGPRELQLADRAGHVKQLFRFEKPLSEGMDVSPDGLTLYFGQMDQDGTEIMLVEGFWH